MSTAEQPTFLIANDQADYIALLSDAVSGHGHFARHEIHSAFTVDEAVSVFEAKHPTHAFIDCNFQPGPREDRGGVGVIQQCRKIEVQKDRLRAYLAMVTASYKIGFEPCSSGAKNAGADAAISIRGTNSIDSLHALLDAMASYEPTNPAEFFEIGYKS